MSYDFTIAKNIATPDNIINTIQKYGVVHIPEYASVSNIETTMRQLLDNETDSSYEFGKAARYRGDDLNKLSQEILDLFDNELSRSITQDFFKGPHHFNQEIFITHEYQNDNGLARNGFLHFDRMLTFKLFYYVLDTNASNGAFSCVPGSHIKGESLRCHEWAASNDYAEIGNRLAIDHPDLGYNEDSAIPIEGPAGTLIIFITDTFHKGGIVEDGKERLVIRSHSRLT